LRPPHPGLLEDSRLRRVLGLAFVLFLALAIRLIYLWQVRGIPTMRLPLVDSQIYYEWSARIAAGEWWRGPVFYQAPLYPYFLAATRLLGGDHLVVIRMVQALLGAVSCVLLAVAAARFAGWTVGVVAGVLLAINGPCVYFGGLLQKTVLDTLLLTALLACLAYAPDRPRWELWIGAGILIGLLALSRENALLLAVTLPLWVLVGFRRLPTRLRAGWITAFVAGLALVLTPVGVRNAAMGGGFLITTSQLGTNLYFGNNPDTDGIYVPLRPNRQTPDLEQIDAAEIAEAAVGHRLSPREVSEYWLSRAVDFMVTQPGRWMKLTARKLLLLFNATEIIDIEDYYYYAKVSWLLRALDVVSHFGIVLALAVAGMAMSWRERSRLWVPYVVLLTLLSATLPFCISARYRFPLVPSLLVFAALAMVGAVDRMRRRDLRSLALPAVAAVAGIAIAALPIVARTPVQRGGVFANLGFAAWQLGRVDEALRFQDEAIRLAPTLASPHLQRAILLSQAGRPEEAKAEYEKTLELEPTNQRAAVDLEQLLIEQGRYDEAQRFSERIASQQPDNAEIRITLAEALGRLGRLSEARTECEKAIAIDPHSGRAFGILGLLSLADADTIGAIEALRRATAVEPGLPEPHFNLGVLLAASARHPEPLAEAETQLRSAIALRPGYPNAHLQLFRVLLRRGNVAGVRAYADSARGAGASADLVLTAGWTLREAGHVAEAIDVLTAGRQDFPEHLGIATALAWYLATTTRADLRDPARALTLAEAATRLGGPSPYVVDTKAAALAANGQFAEAAEAAAAAANLARERRDDALAREIKARELLYRAGKPFIDR
jgi:tetratricopeptide (TPR) repeat protein